MCSPSHSHLSFLSRYIIVRVDEGDLLNNLFKGDSDGVGGQNE